LRFESGNLDEFIKVVESEALIRHAMMMTSDAVFHFNETKHLGNH
jgi:diphosphomevalonate decarboxylase